MLFGLLGYPLSHSFSQPYFTSKFAQLGLSATHRYVNFEVEFIDVFPDILARHPDLHGLNVTIPHKETVIPFLDELSPAAREIGAVNTIVVQKGKTIGYNTDVLGFRNDFLDFIEAKPFQKSHGPETVPLPGEDAQLKRLSTPDLATLKSRRSLPTLHGKPLAELKALVLGTGGASLAVHYALNELGILTTAVSRTPANQQISYQDLTAKRLQEYTFVVNTTPLGMSPKVEGIPDLPYAAFTSQHYCYDIVYNPEVTRFLSTAAQYGAHVRNGLGMLHGQAEAAWSIWTSTPTKKNEP